MFTMFPLKYADFIAIRKMEGSDESAINIEELNKAGYGLRKEFANALQKKDFSEFFKFANHVDVTFSNWEIELHKYLTDYFSRGGYPEVAITEEPSSCQKLLRSYANDIIVKDLMPWFRIRDFDTAEKLLFLLAGISGGQMNVQGGIMKRLPGSKEMTVRKYIEYFQSLSIISIVQIYSGSKLGSSKNPKIYFNDIGMRNALLGILDAEIDPSERGHVAETVAFDHIMRLAYKLNESSPGKVSCYRGKGGAEVDFIVDLPRYGMKLPVEIKFGSSSKNIKGINEFMKKKNQNLAVVITEKKMAFEKGIAWIPMWMFLLMC